MTVVSRFVVQLCPAGVLENNGGSLRSVHVSRRRKLPWQIFGVQAIRNRTFAASVSDIIKVVRTALCHRYVFLSRKQLNTPRRNVHPVSKIALMANWKHTVIDRHAPAKAKRTRSSPSIQSGKSRQKAASTKRQSVQKPPYNKPS